MTIVTDCREVARLIPALAEQQLSSSDRGAVQDHLRACPSCRDAALRYGEVQDLLKGVYGPDLLSPSFTAETGRRLLAVQPLPAELAPRAFEAVPSFPFESLVRRAGGAPWWMLSGAFHVLLLLLITLVGAALLRSRSDKVVIVTDLEKQQEPPEVKKELPRDIFKQPVEFETPQVSAETTIVTHEEVEVADQVETANEADVSESRGEDGISDAFLGGSGTVAALGLGGGSSGAFGRPSSPGGRLRRAIQGGGGKATESAVNAGLEWLARNQEADGHWDACKHGAAQAQDLAVTGFALLAFLGAGHSERVGKYKENVKKAVAWLIGQQKANGEFLGQRSYPHGIVSIAMSEAAGLGRVAETKAAAQKAIEYAEYSQRGVDSDRDGWGYYAKARRTDLSVSGWHIMALKSAKVAGLRVDAQALQGAINALDNLQEKLGETDGYDAYRFWYSGTLKEYPKNGDNHTNHRLSAIGCLCRMFLGTDAQQMEPSVRTFLKQAPSNEGLPWWNNDGSAVDLYYWYYGTLCCFQVGGEVWKNWNEAMKQALLPHQRQGGAEDGSWDIVGTLSTEWGRVGQTALSILCLEVYYRYLPLYR